MANVSFQLHSSTLNHMLREPLAAEVHSRPFMKLQAPEMVTHFAIFKEFSGAGGKPQLLLQHETLAALCSQFGVASPCKDVKHFYHDFGPFRLKWECHAEFATYTFTKRCKENIAITDAFSEPPLLYIPEEWLRRLTGMLMVAAHVFVMKSATPVECFAERLGTIFEGYRLVSSEVLKGGEVWTDFLIQADGFSRFVVRDIDLLEFQAGRLVQRVLEIETYRMMALLALPLAQKAILTLNEIEYELTPLTVEMAANENETLESTTKDNEEQDHRLLGTITKLAARIEKLSLTNSYRFSASQAYFGLVRARIEELRETRFEGYPTIGEFMERRLTPAMNTCVSVGSRQEMLAHRIANANDLLRTRIGIVQEQQNRKILESMNKRAAQQLRVQQAVEGLSVAAISYYLVGLCSYIGKAAKAGGLYVNPDVAAGILVPFIAVGVWSGLRRMHKRIHNS